MRNIVIDIYIEKKSLLEQTCYDVCMKCGLEEYIHQGHLDHGKEL